MSAAEETSSPDREPRIIQFSGVVMTSDSLMGIPFVTIYIPNSRKGTVTNSEGYFSFVAEEGDSVRFSCIGFKPAIFAIPKTVRGDKFSIIHLMSPDTTYLDTILIFPWPSRDQFRQAFISLEVPDDDLERAKKNLEQEYLRELGLYMENDGNEATDFYLRSEARKFYSAGQQAPQMVFNAFAWAKFIQAWKRGDFKKRDKPYIPKDQRSDGPTYDDLKRKEEDGIRY